MNGAKRRERLWCAIVAAAAFAFLAWRAGGVFTGADGRLGHDYAWFLPMLVVGHAWSRQQGWLSPPYFTPAMCGGVPFLGNPQSVFYSLPQGLLLALEPASAMLATLLIAAVGGAAGCYVLLRRGLAASAPAATLGATLVLLNGFLFYRMAVGHLTYHVIAVAPLLAALVARSQGAGPATNVDRARHLAVSTVIGGILVAYVTYGGGLHLQVPIVLSVAGTLLILQIARGFRATPWLVLAGSCAWGALLSAMKLAPAAVLASRFPRGYLPSHLFQSPLDLARTLASGLFVPAALPREVQFGTGAWLGRHEFELGLSVVPLVLLILAVRHGRRLRLRFQRPLLWAALAVVLLVPIALTLGPPAWGETLLRVPVINNNTTLVRWWVVYLLPIVLLSVRAFDVAVSPARRPALLVVCVLLMVAQESARHGSRYYRNQATYDPAPVTRTYREVAQGYPLPGIERIALESERPNDAFVEGVSAWPCYEPLFGYAHELAPDLRLTEGPVELVSADGGRLNLIDPAAYVAGRVDGAADLRFETTRLPQALRFASHQPYDWREPSWHALARRVTLAAVLLSMAVLAVGVAARLSHRGRAGRVAPAGDARADHP